jgi:hypothetical protein
MLHNLLFFYIRARLEKYYYVKRIILHYRIIAISHKILNILRFNSVKDVQSKKI